MSEPKKTDASTDRLLEKDDLSESESRVVDEVSRDIDHCWLQDVERLDEIIGRYLPIAQSAEQDFDRALRASYIVLELIDMESTLLESYNAGIP